MLIEGGNTQVKCKDSLITFVINMLYIAHHAMTKPNDKIDLNAQADLNLMTHLLHADARTAVGREPQFANGDRRPTPDVRSAVARSLKSHSSSPTRTVPASDGKRRVGADLPADEAQG